MIDALDPLVLARIQFAFTIAFHIIFPAFTIGLASWLAVLEGFYLKTGKQIYINIYKFWLKIFAVSFAMGVVSGVVMSYQFGTNWSGFSHKVGNVIGPLMNFEVMTAFFLEASFLGIMLFGWERVSAKMHFFATVIVALGTLLSAFWIISANSWMHTPAGFKMEDGIMYPTDWFEVIFNPSFFYRFPHMVTAAYLTTAFAVLGVGSWYLSRKKFMAEARIMVGMAIFLILCLAPLQLLLGDLHGLNTLQYQPQKVAAMEGTWEDEKGAPVRIFAIPDSEQETNHYSLDIPKLGSLILTHSSDGEIKGLKSWPKEDRPPITIVFFAFRIMVAIGFLMFITAALAVILYFRGKLFSSKLFQRWCLLMSPSGFIAILSGWFVTEVGRQPFVVYGWLRTQDAASPVLGHVIAISLIAFILIYMFIFGMGIYYIFHLIGVGPKEVAQEETFGTHGVKHPVTIDEALHMEDKHV
jgi:cytochrome d ubiquinol oxidase subunit I